MVGEEAPAWVVEVTDICGSKDRTEYLDDDDTCFPMKR
jgi:hypothetical protein